MESFSWLGKQINYPGIRLQPDRFGLPDLGVADTEPTFRVDDFKAQARELLTRHK